jgi:cobalt-zinc-cadmium efflux system protein
MQHHHGHTIRPASRGPSKRNLIISIVLKFIITATKFVGGILSNSLALLSDALHNLSDTFAIYISYVAIKLGEKGSNKSPIP